MPSPGSKPEPGAPGRLTRRQIALVREEAGPVLARFAGFLISVREEGFSNASRALIGSELPHDPLSMMALLAGRLTEPSPEPVAAVLGKSLQEILFRVAGLGYDLEGLDADRGARDYFRKSSLADALVALLESYVSGAIRIGLEGQDRRGVSGSGPAPSPAAIDEVSRRAVRSALDVVPGSRNGRVWSRNARMGSEVVTAIREALLASRPNAR